jgi:hypothetical protein
MKLISKYHKKWTIGERDGQKRHTWLETDLAWHPSNGKINISPWQANWHHYLPWSVLTYNFGRIFVSYKMYHLRCHRGPIDPVIN